MKMKQLLSLLMMGAAGISAFAAAGEKDNGILVVYFSWSSAQNTKQMAEEIASAVGVDLFRIETAETYPADYNQTVRIAKEEVQKNARPQLKTTVTQAEMDRYDTVFVGYPVAVYTFLESFDLSGKTVIPFATSGGSGLSDRNLRAKITATFKDGLCIAGYRPGESSRRQITKWLSGLGFVE